MKNLTLLLLLSAFSLSTAFADGDSTTSKLIKAKVLTDKPNSTTGKLIKLDAKTDVLKDKDDSGMEKIIKLKMVDEIAK